MKFTRKAVVQCLSEQLAQTEIDQLKQAIAKLRQEIAEVGNDTVRAAFPETTAEFLIAELDQIAETRSIERLHYYLRRLIKGLTDTRTNAINDINLNLWKQYEDIITDSLWLIEKRDSSGVHNGSYWGNFVPQIPNQLIKRYTKKGEWVLDPFLGQGTTLIECQRLERNGIGIELQEDIAATARKMISEEENLFSNSTQKVEVGDCTEVDYSRILQSVGIEKVQLVVMHPPYWDIIQFSQDEKDFSNLKTLDSFLTMVGKAIEKSTEFLDRGRYLSIVMGDKYQAGEWIPLGFYCMLEAMKRGFVLKSTIVKNFDVTKGKRLQQDLWRYRALAGGFYVFKHEYIFVMRKK